MAACDPFSMEEMRAMLESRALGVGDRARNQCLFALECCTGARISEVLSLRRGDVLDEAGRIREKVTFVKTKNGRPRTVPIVNAFLLPYLESWLVIEERYGFRLAESPVFPSMGRGRGTISRLYVWKLYRRAARELGLIQRVGTHSCRKTWAKATYEYFCERQRAGENINPLLKLQEAGGWRTLDSVSKYLNYMLGDTSESQKAIFSGLAGKEAG